MRHSLLPLLAAVCVASGCSKDAASRLILTQISPAALPESLDTTLEIAGRNLSGSADLILEVVGRGNFDCTILDDLRARCRVPAGALAAGTHRARLRRGLRVTKPVDLGVNPQPVLESFSPGVVDGTMGAAFTLTGSGFLAPVQVLCTDAAGKSVALPASGAVSPDGKTVTGRLPPLDSTLRGRLTLQVQIRNGDGQSAVGAIDLVCEAKPSGDRTIDGRGNNPVDPARGSAGIQLLRLVAPDYADGVSQLAGPQRRSARAISNLVCEQVASTPNAAQASGFLWQWGQFVDHDIDLTPAASPVEPAPIAVPAGDPFFDPLSTGAVEIGLQRSLFDPASSPRQQTNVITAFLDGSNVYGSDAARAAELRTQDGTGRLKTSAGNLLPFNIAGLPNAPTGLDPTLFLAGDVRANEQVGLTAVHALFVREHNRLADSIRGADPQLSGDEIYERARRLVGAEIQIVTYREFLPLLLGTGALAPYSGFRENVDPGIANLFSTACYRMGHSLLSGRLLRLDANGDEVADGHLALRDAFFNPLRLIDEGGIEPVLRGLAAQQSQELDTELVDDVRNFLFGPPGAGGFDLGALNIQRGRDHGLPGYNDTRERLGLARRTSLAQITANTGLQARLAQAYNSADDIDLWVGSLAEDHVAGAMVGETLFVVLRDQFERIRDGDRFWYERLFDPVTLQQLEATTLADIIRRNTTIGNELPDDVFRTVQTP